jgi:hypothetical protein
VNPTLLCIAIVLLAGCAKPSLKPVTVGRLFDGYAVVKNADDKLVFVIGVSGITLCDSARLVWEKRDGVSYPPCRPVAIELGNTTPNAYVAIGTNPDVQADYISFVGGPTQADCDTLRIAFTLSADTSRGWTNVPCRAALLTVK